MSEIGFRVSSVDRNNHTVHMMVNGCPVTAVCTPTHHPEVYEQVKSLLIGSIVNSPIVKYAPSRGFVR